MTYKSRVVDKTRSEITLDGIDGEMFCQCEDVKDGEYVSVEIKKWRKARTQSQNAIFHALCADIARASGMNAELVKEGIKEQYGVKVEIIINGDRVKVCKPSHLCDVAEMAALISGAEMELVEYLR